MKKSFKILLLIVLIITVFAGGGALSFLYFMTKSPEKVTATVQHQLQKNLGVPVTIDRARFEWKSGPRVILTKVNINEPGVITLHIRSITAYLSIWKFLLGDVSVGKVRLIKPEGIVDLDNMKNLKTRDAEGKRPVVLIWKGSMKIIYHGVDVPLTDVSGRITYNWANLRARTLGGRVLLETDLERPGKLTFDAYGISLDQLDGRMKGTAHASITIEDTREGQTGSFSLQVKGLHHPWIHGTMDRLSASASLEGNGNRMRITDITFRTPVIEVSGKGEIAGFTDIASWEDVRLNLEASSKAFDYEKVVSVLPVERFPGWLRELLTRQIRNGRSRFSTAQYQGPVKGFFSGVELLDNLHVVQELKGQSFSAGHGVEKVTGITGQVVYGKGDIRFRNLTGTVGTSHLNRVDIVFPGAVKPLMRVGVDVDVDMPAADFLRAWQASMVPEEIHHLLRPVAGVKAGHIKGRVSTYYDEQTRNPFTAKGDIRLTDCAFMWGAHAVTGLIGTIHADSYAKPQSITLSGMVDKTRIRKLQVSLFAPFGDSTSRFTLTADRLPAVGKITPEDATLKVTGRGRGLDLNGTVEMNAQGIAFAGDERTYRARAVTAQGEFKARLGKRSDISLNTLVIRNPSGRVEGSADIRGNNGLAVLSGRVDLKDISLQGKKVIRPLGGVIDGNLSLEWGNTLKTSGNVTLHDAVFPLAEDFMTVNGALVIMPSKVSVDGLKVRIGDVRSTLSGDLTRDAHPSFKGMVSVEGLTVGGQGRGFEGLRDLRADARLQLARCVFFGLPVETATADAQLKDGMLRLDNAIMETVSGTAKGSAHFSLEGGSSFDMMISLKDSDLRKLLKAANGTSAIDGMLDVEGRLWGSADSLNGTLVVHAKDGEIRRYALVSQVFSLLNVYRIARNQDTDFLSRHFTYNHINTTLTIKDNVVDFDDFTLESNSIQVSAIGKYSLDSKKIDAVMGVQPLESVDRAISMIPVVGWVLTGENGRFIVVSMKVGGTIDDPKVMVAPIDTLSNTVAASLLRSLRLPGKLIEESLKLINGKKE